MADLIDKGLKAFIKAMKEPPYAQVGILTGKSKNRKGVGSTNAEIGAAHEFGAPARGLPQRSFLRMPINEQLEKVLGKDALAVRKEFEKAAKDGSLVAFAKKLGAAGEAVCRDAFTTGGYGHWAPLTAYTLEHKAGANRSTILVDTTQLRESITYRVVK